MFSKALLLGCRKWCLANWHTHTLPCLSHSICVGQFCYFPVSYWLALCYGLFQCRSLSSSSTSPATKFNRSSKIKRTLQNPPVSFPFKKHLLHQWWGSLVNLSPSHSHILFLSLFSCMVSWFSSNSTNSNLVYTEHTMSNQPCIYLRYTGYLDRWNEIYK